MVNNSSMIPGQIRIIPAMGRVIWDPEGVWSGVIWFLSNLGFREEFEP